MASIVPSEPHERSTKVVWPSIGAYRLGRLVGRLCAIRLGLGSVLTLGNLFALATIPLSLALYVWKALPGVMRRYRLTDRRVVVQRGLTQVEERSIRLDEFDAIDVLVLPGQQWLRCGELIFTRGGQELLRLSGVLRPEIFRQVCLKQRATLLAVREVLRQQEVASV